MHPAYSVIFFTTASGAGYGLWFWLGLRLLTDGTPDRPGAAIVTLVIGGILVTLGLLSSTFHLGHPERAWRAFSQWRSSWLSREGVAAVATYLPAAVIFLLLAFGGTSNGVVAFLLSVGSVVTVWCTGMIYASLRTVPEWNHGLVPVMYLVLAAATGALLLGALDGLFGQRSGWVLIIGLLAFIGAAALKWAYWQRLDTAPAPYNLKQAMGIPGAAGIRPLDPPHTQPNFVMREMGYAVARRHASRLRVWVMALLFAVPMACIVLGLLVPAIGPVLLLLAVFAAAAGVWAERWLFFAEAKHVSMLYYGAQLGGHEAVG